VNNKWSSESRTLRLDSGVGMKGQSYVAASRIAARLDFLWSRVRAAYIVDCCRRPARSVGRWICDRPR
jgi:hypothetical protein